MNECTSRFQIRIEFGIARAMLRIPRAIHRNDKPFPLAFTDQSRANVQHKKKKNKEIMQQKERKKEHKDNSKRKERWPTRIRRNEATDLSPDFLLNVNQCCVLATLDIMQ